MYSTDKLYSKNKQGKIRWWQAHCFATYDLQRLVFVEDPGAPAYTYTTYGNLGGKETTSKYKTVTGKNAGRSNATTPLQQAKLEIARLYQDKCNEGMKTSVEALVPATIDQLIDDKAWRVNVMLLHDWKKYGDRIAPPYWVQPKLDGAHFVVFYHPRVGVDTFLRGKTKNPVQLHITEAFEALLDGQWQDGIYVTGELWLPNTPRQNIESMANQEKWEGVTTKLAFNVFDVFWIGCQADFTARWEIAKAIVAYVNSPHVVLTETLLVDSVTAVDEYFHKQVQAGMEGIVVRDPRGLYEYGIYKPIRSYAVLKYKNREDSEFRIVDVREGAGKYVGCAIFVMETTTGKRFAATSPGTIEEKQKFWIDRATYVGRQAVVEYDGLSTDGVPQQPVIKAVL